MKKETVKIDAGEYEQPDLVGIEQMKKEYGEPAEIEMSDEDGMIRLTSYYIGEYNTQAGLDNPRRD